MELWVETGEVGNWLGKATESMGTLLAAFAKRLGRVPRPRQE